MVYTQVLISLQPLAHLNLTPFSFLFFLYLTVDQFAIQEFHIKVKPFIFQLCNERIKVSVIVNTSSFNKLSVVHVFWKIYRHPPQ